MAKLSSNSRVPGEYEHTAIDVEDEGVQDILTRIEILKSAIHVFQFLFKSPILLLDRCVAVIWIVVRMLANV